MNNNIVGSYAKWLHPCLSPTGPGFDSRTRPIVWADLAGRRLRPVFMWLCSVVCTVSVLFLGTIVVVEAFRVVSKHFIFKQQLSTNIQDIPLWFHIFWFVVSIIFQIKKNRLTLICLIRLWNRSNYPHRGSPINTKPKSTIAMNRTENYILHYLSPHCILGPRYPIFYNLTVL
jgi:hypothetical protein